MQYSYALLSERDYRFYTGCTDDLRKRVRERLDGFLLGSGHNKLERY